MFNCDYETWGAETALNSAFCNESILHLGERAIYCETFDCFDIGVNRCGRHDKTRANCLVIDNDGATAAFSLLASTFRAWQTKTLTKNIKQTFADPRVANLVSLAIDREIVNFRVGVHFVFARESNRRDKTATAWRRYAAVLR